MHIYIYIFGVFYENGTYPQLIIHKGYPSG